jgi:hypothetical protein
VVPTTLPATTTTTAAADATTADPQVLARQLQSVLDRYAELYVASRTDPNRPFTDAQLIADFQEIATNEYIGLNLSPSWSQYRTEGSAVRQGANGASRYLLTRLVATGPATASLTYCVYDDATTVRVSTGEVLDDLVYVVHRNVDVAKEEGRWRLARSANVEAHEVPRNSNPCAADALVQP